MPAIHCRNVRVVEGNVETLARENAQLKHDNTELHKHVEILREEIAWYKEKLFGRSSEKLSAAELEQIRLFDEAEAAIAQREAEEQLQLVPAHVRHRPVRRPLPASLPRQEVLVDISEAEKHCGCGHELVRIGEESSEKLDVIPPQVRVIRTVRPKYACHHCEGSGDEGRPAVRIAPAPAAIIEKGIATPGLLAYIATAKFCDALPLYRQEKQFLRYGVELARQTMADWMIATAEACAPLMKLLEARVRSGPLLQLDETRVQVLGETGRANTSLSFMWVARGGLPEAPVILYHYAPSRGAEVAQQMLGDYRGYLQTDGYEAYDRVCDGAEGVVHVGCLAHVRRDFHDAHKSSKKSGSAEEALATIARVYRVESSLREQYADAQEFAAERRRQVEPILAEFRAWLDRRSTQVPPGTLLGKAISYALGQWPKLIRYLEHPAMTPDTNAVENSIRPFAVGRRNWLFSGSPRGATASATLFSIIETARANGKEPYWYLRQLFEGLPTATTEAEIAKLAPFRTDSS